MTTYIATFSNGTTKKIANSVRIYSHAWCVAWHRIGVSGTVYRRCEAGFARSQTLAERSRDSCISRALKRLAYAMSDDLPAGTGATLDFSEVVAVRTP